MMRDQYCGQFDMSFVGKKARACGWVSAKRDMGGVLFIDLYDKTGVLQVVFNRQVVGEKAFNSVERLRMQSVIAVEGLLQMRDEETRNPRIATGEIELRASGVELLSQAASLPFPLDGGPVREDLRLEYRYLDLRRPEMQKNLHFRYSVQKAAERYLDSAGFLSVETPMLIKSTPEGARDYLVPSRVHKGSFYALPQSPQIFKQLLMVGGIDKYFQIARCFRDEDLRADRQPEFTQVDMEMAFVRQEDILVTLENMLKSIFSDVMGFEVAGKFPRITWTQAMDTYGSDKPDLRFDLPIVELTGVLSECSFKVFRSVIECGGVVRAINVKGGASMSRSEIDRLTQKAQSYGASGMAWVALRENGEMHSILEKYLSARDMDAILSATHAQPGDFVLFCADTLSAVRQILGRLRLDIADMQGLRQENEYRFLFVTDFPLFEFSEEQGRLIASHHPFTMPHPEDIAKLESDPENVRAQAYDLVLNGVELGSGSIRIHDSELQKKMFRILGFTQKQVSERFGFMIEAFRYGTPPHGGFAFGLDRLVMLLLGASSLRDVIAFPKTKDASCPLTSSPSPVAEVQLEALGISAISGAVTRETAESAAQTPDIDVDKIALLSRLKLSNNEKAGMEKDMRSIVAFANTLSAIDTEGIAPAIHALPMKNVFRRDEVRPPMPRDALLGGAPDAWESYILVPRILE